MPKVLLQIIQYVRVCTFLAVSDHVLLFFHAVVPIYNFPISRDTEN